MLDLALNLIPAVPREDSQQFQKLRQEDFAGRKISLKNPHSPEANLVIQPHPGRRDPGRNMKGKPLIGIVSVVWEIFLPIESSYLHSGDFPGGKNRPVPMCA
jgi:hypothetical protein